MDDLITIFLVDDHAVVREGLKAILSREPDLVVVGEASDAESALDSLEVVAPRVVVLDQRLPGMSGLDLCREIAERRLHSEVVILTAFQEQDAIQNAFRAGARAYVVKDVDSTELQRAIRAAARGRSTVDPSILPGPGVRENERSMPPRCKRVLVALAQGLSAPAIASQLGLSLHTVKSYMREIYSLLEVTNRSEAVSSAARRGLI